MAMYSEDNAEQVHGIEDVEYYVASKGCRLQLIYRMSGNAGICRFIIKLAPLPHTKE
jgi:hypothetical protein